ncbi:MAG: hypothetical protein R3C05_12255 [Pirellulaceae bacterium]
MVESLEPRMLLAGDLTNSEIDAISQDQVLALLRSLDAGARKVNEDASLNAPLPGVGGNLNQLFDSDPSNGRSQWGDLLKLEHVTQGYFGRFDPSNESLFDISTVGTRATSDGLRDALIEHLKAVTADFGIPEQQIIVAGGLSEENLLRFDIQIEHESVQQLIPSLDALGSRWTELGVELGATSTIDVTTNLIFDVSFGVEIGGSSDNPSDPLELPTIASEGFIEVNRFSIDTSIDASGSQFDFSMGPVDGNIVATAFTVDAGVAIEIPAAAADVVDRIGVTQLASPLDIQFAFDANLFNASLGDRSNVPGSLPGVTIADSNVLDQTQAETFDHDLAPLIMHLPADHVVEGLKRLATSLDQAVASDTLSQKIPLINKTLGELLTSPAEPRTFSGSQILSMTSPIVDEDSQRFTATLDTDASSLGIKPGDLVRFLATNGDRFTANVESVAGNQVVIGYDASRTDQPNTATPSLSFSVSGTIGNQLLSALGNFGRDGEAIPSIGNLLEALSGPMGLDLDNVTFDETNKFLELTATFTPAPLTFKSRLDFGESIDSLKNLQFDESGDIIVNAAPTIRLPLGFNLDPDAPINAADRLFIIEDSAPEVTVDITADMDKPQARGTLGFLTTLLTETSSGDAVELDTTLTINIIDPVDDGDGNTKDDIRATTTEIEASVSESLLVGYEGSLNIAGLSIKPELAGALIPGEITISTSGPVAFNDPQQLDGVMNQIVVSDNPFNSFDSLSPDSVVTMFLQLGNSIQAAASELDVPGGIPFVEDAISEVLDFVDTTQDLAPKLYFNAKLIGDAEISVTDGRLSDDAFFAVRLEGSDSVFVTIPAAMTVDNTSIDDLYADINQALRDQGLDGSLVADRQLPVTGSQIESLTIGDAIIPGGPIAPLPVGFVRFTATLDEAIDLFNAGSRVGDVIEYVDIAGRTQSAVIDQLTQHEISFRFDAEQAVPRTDAGRSLSIHDANHANRLAIRTVDPTEGVSMEISTLSVTASRDAPIQLQADSVFELVIDDQVHEVTITADSTADNLAIGDLVDSINAALLDLELNKQVQAIVHGDFIRFVSLAGGSQSLSIRGAEELGFAASQEKDANTAASELGLAGGQIAEADFRVNTIQDLVHTLNGFLRQSLSGIVPENEFVEFSTVLGYEETQEEGQTKRTVTFDIDLGAEYRRSVDLNFNQGLDVGFAELSVAGAGQAEFIARAGVELAVGIDLQRPGSGTTIESSTLLSELDNGRGARVNVGVIGATISSSGRPSTVPDEGLTLKVRVDQYGDASDLVEVNVSKPLVEDNTSLEDLAADLNARCGPS